MNALKNLFGICIIALIMIAFLDFLDDIKEDNGKIVNLDNYRRTHKKY